ncbi:MAG: zf-TFIIB domain-containing protein [Planctomycetaceae bacterium]|nr:zf-TFIIB domain-containing protein [Planctomycetaceae bacterium]
MFAPNSSASPHTAESICCRQCGGTLQEVSGREYLQCEYCLSLHFPFDDPLKVDQLVVSGEPVTSECPICSESLTGGNLDDVRVLHCKVCYGILLRNTDFGKVVSNRRSDRGAGVGEIPLPLDPRQYQRQLNCPSCHGPMEAHPYYGPGNSVIDSCCRCQLVWLDHGELRRIVRAAGGQQ